MEKYLTLACHICSHICDPRIVSHSLASNECSSTSLAHVREKYHQHQQWICTSKLSVCTNPKTVTQLIFPDIFQFVSVWEHFLEIDYHLQSSVICTATILSFNVKKEAVSITISVQYLVVFRILSKK